MLVLVISLFMGSVAVGLATVTASTSYPFLLSLFALFILIAVLPIFYRLLIGTFDTLEAENFFILFYSLYSLCVPLNLLFSPYIAMEELHICTQALMLCLIGLIFFILGYHSHLGNILARMIPLLPYRWNPKRVRYTAQFFIFCGILFFVVLTKEVGISTYFKAGYMGRALLKRESGPLELGLYICQIGLILYGFYYFMTKKRINFYIIIVLYSLYILFVLRIGIRRPILALSVAYFAGRYYLVKRISFIKAFPIILTCGVLLVIFAFVRHIIADSGFSIGIKYLINNFSWSWLDLSKTEFGAPFKNLVDILAILPGQAKHLYGLSYWQTIEILFPRYIYPSRPPTLSEWYTNTFFSEGFVRAGGNMGFFIISEAYINWDIIGVMIVMFSWGILLKALYNYMRRGLRNISAIFIYCVSLVWIVFAIRLDFAVVLKSFLVTTFLPMIFAIMFITIKFKSVRS